MNQPTLTITFNGKFSSVGILLTFNLLSGDYATELNIKWYEDGHLLSSKDFEPDSSRFFCNNYVQNYNTIVITFKKTSKPYRPVFLTRIDYGLYEISCLMNWLQLIAYKRSMQYPKISV